jgi:hypothetical protein
VDGGGLARIEQEVSYEIDDAGSYYRATWTLSGMEKRFDEVHNIRTALDGVSVGDAINVLLTSSGFEPLLSIPAYAASIKIPGVPAGSDSWKWGINFGDSAENAIKKLLFYLRRQNSEYRLRYDWAAASAPDWKGHWVLELKPRDTSAPATWTLTPFEDEIDEAARIIPFGGTPGPLFTFKPTPPDGNVIAPLGMTGTNPNKSKIVPGTPIRNVASLTDPDSPNFLGRVVHIFPYFPEVTDPAIININGRRIYAMVGSRKMETKFGLRNWYSEITAGKQIRLRGFKVGEMTRSIIGSTWCKRKTLVLAMSEDACLIPMVTLACCDIWESDIDE